MEGTLALLMRQTAQKAVLLPRCGEGEHVNIYSPKRALEPPPSLEPNAHSTTLTQYLAKVQANILLSSSHLVYNNIFVLNMFYDLVLCVEMWQKYH